MPLLFDAARFELFDKDYELTVLFADLRGYTAYSEQRAAAEIFALVESFVRSSGAILSSHGGRLLEFAGDGVMAVFGPSARGSKERAAIDAAVEINNFFNTVHERDARWPLAVGIGIATGATHVGTILSSELRIVAAVGNATNLAARLQTWTRSVDAMIAVDARTFAAAGPMDVSFEEYAQAPIPGRSRPETIYCIMNVSGGNSASRGN